MKTSRFFHLNAALLGILLCGFEASAQALDSGPRFYKTHSARAFANLQNDPAAGNMTALFTPPYKPPYATFQPSQLAAAYGFNAVTATGAGQTIAIVDAYGSSTLQSDLNAYSKAFNLPATQVQIVYPYGAPTTTNSDWALETDIDVEFAHSIAPAAKIILFVTPDSGSSLDTVIQYISQHASALGISVVSMSWYGDEWSNESYYDSYMSIPGVTWVACSGDSGQELVSPRPRPMFWESVLQN